MIFYLRDGDLPAEYGVALGAIGAHLPAVDVGVAVGAILANVGEDRLDVAIHAFHVLVHATQWVTRFVVIKLQYWANGSPAGSNVAIFARNVEHAVGTFRIWFLRGGKSGDERKQPNDEQEAVADVSASKRKSPLELRASSSHERGELLRQVSTTKAADTTVLKASKRARRKVQFRVY